MSAPERASSAARSFWGLRSVRHNYMTTAAPHHYGGPEWRETREKKAQRILSEQLEQCGYNLETLKHLRKGDPSKIKIACRLRSETTMTWAWIANHLAMGAPGSVANLLRKNRKV